MLFLLPTAAVVAAELMNARQQRIAPRRGNGQSRNEGDRSGAVYHCGIHCRSGRSSVPAGAVGETRFGCPAERRTQKRGFFLPQQVNRADTFKP